MPGSCLTNRWFAGNKSRRQSPFVTDLFFLVRLHRTQKYR